MREFTIELEEITNGWVVEFNLSHKVLGESFAKPKFFSEHTDAISYIREFLDREQGIETKKPSAQRVFVIDGFWNDGSEKFKSMLVTDSETPPEGYEDDHFFFYGITPVAGMDTGDFTISSVSEVRDRVLDS